MERDNPEIWGKGKILGCCVLKGRENWKEGKFIFVTVGTGPYQFTRLLKILDKMAPRSKYKIIAQTGQCTYKPKNYEYFKFSSRDERNYLMKNAYAVINHGGAGSIIESLMYKTPTIIFPRQVKYREHKNDSSIILGETMKSKGLAMVAYNEADLRESIKDAKKLKIQYSKDKTLIKNLKKYLKTVKTR